MRYNNSNNIIKSIRDNKGKFELIQELSHQLREVKEERRKKVREISKIYDIVLKILSSKKKKVGVIEGNEYYVGLSGISRKATSYHLNTDNIRQSRDFEKELLIVKQHLSLFLKQLTKKKKQVLSNFIRKADMLKEKDNIYMRIDTDVEMGDDKKKTVKGITINVDYNTTLNLDCGEDYSYHRDNFNLIHPTLTDKIVIEQICSQIRRLLKREIELRKMELDNVQKYITDLDFKFSKYIKSINMLKELRKG